MLNLILILLAVVSAILFTVMIISFVSDTKKRNQYSECIGTIERIWKRKSPGERSNQQIISPIISYTVGGEKYEIVGTSYSTNIEIGEEVVVLFNEGNPSKAMMKKGLYFTSFVSGIVGLAFATAFIVMSALKYAGLISF